MITQKFLQQKTITTQQAKSAYPELTLTSTPNNNTSLATQVKRQFKNGYARLITNNIYRLTLSKTVTVMDKSDIDNDLKTIGLTPDQIQYIEQTNHTVTINITMSPNLLNKLMKG